MTERNSKVIAPAMQSKTEKLIHKTVKKFSYSPKIGFSGMGECYVDTKAVLDKIFSLLTNLND